MLGSPRINIKSTWSLFFGYHQHFHMSLTSQMVKNLPAVPETWVQSVGWEDPLEKGIATHSSIPAWRIPWTEEPGGLQSQTQLSN